MTWRRPRLGGWAAGGLAAVLVASLSAREVQQHGLAFEQWVRETFFGGCPPGAYTQKWDIPAAANVRHGGIPVNPKTARYGSPVDLGDALRQFEIAQGGERFLLIVAFWRQATPEEKEVVNVQAVEVTPQLYRSLWGSLTRRHLEDMDRLVKDRSLSVEECRQRAAELKRTEPFRSALIRINPKIDARQRRVQCSISFRDFFRHVVRAEPALQAQPALFGRKVPVRWRSGPRTFRRDDPGD